MCGIAGIFAYRDTAPPVDVRELSTIRDTMVARGPDGEGLWLSPDGRVGLANRRLAIIDLSESGAQPMTSSDHLVHITFNGEIYNYRELRAQLVAKGYRFRSTSDTEVLLNLYLDRGRAMVQELRGMYAFAIWDDRDGSLFLVRDPFGIKPLYYADDGETIRFASQVKALLRGRIEKAPSPAGYVGFYLWGHLPDPHTLYRGIKALPAGSSLVIDRQAARGPIQFFNVTEEFRIAGESAGEISPKEADERVHLALRESVEHHMVADVPVGVFLSAGIDSATLTSLAAELKGSDLRTITLGFQEYRGTRNDEVPLAELIAGHCGVRHETKWVDKTDFRDELPNLLEAMDQPSIDGVNTYFVSRAAAASGMKVALSGVGGDELFGGYPSFWQVPAMARWLSPWRTFPALGRLFRLISAPILRRFTSPKFAGLLEYGGSLGGAYLLRRGLYMPWELPELLDPDLVREGWNELRTQLYLEQTVEGIEFDAQKVAALELCWYMRNQLLRDSDWAGMAHSVEIRVPYVDVHLFRTVAPLMGAPVTKNRMARAPKKELPTQVLIRKKTGFSIPIREWSQDADSATAQQRGMRSWAVRLLPRPAVGLRMLALLTDAYGGRGGIAKFNRDLLGALCKYPTCREVVALPRLMASDPGPLPGKLTYLTTGLGGKGKYLLSFVRVLSRRREYQLVFCCHINLLPLAWVAGLMTGARLILVIHGIDAWRRPIGGPWINFLLKRVDAFITVSALTAERFLAWSKVNPGKALLIPNSVDLERFKPAPRNPDLVRRHGLQGKTVILTVGRLQSSERYKGVDEILELMPTLIRDIPHLVYLVVGDGDDRQRLERKASSLGIGKHVVFAGYVPEGEKCDYYNLADAFVMPSTGEGFGIVFLEAMACGVPVIGSKIDGGKEALDGGLLGALVDPSHPDEIRQAILRALSGSKRVPSELNHFSIATFEDRVHRALNDMRVTTSGIA